MTSWDRLAVNLTLSGARAQVIEPWCATCASAKRPQPPACAIRTFRCSACHTRIGFCAGCIERGLPVTAMLGHRAVMRGEPADSPYHGCSRGVLEPAPLDEDAGVRR
jgi:hypothetical protein